MPIEISVWEQKVYEFGIELPLPPMPEPSADWGIPGLGLDLKATCPGAAFCGNPDADKNCSVGYKKPLKIPGFSFALPFPPEISIPSVSRRIVFPPSVIIPGRCPNYPEQTAPPEGTT